MAWRREDYGYAAAAIAAVAFLAYLIAGNFGLVPSPLGQGHAEALPQAEVAGLVIANPAARPLPAVAVAPKPAPSGPQVGRGDKAAAALAPPTVRIDTRSGTTVQIAQKATILGRVLASAGVRQVVVQFSSTSDGSASALATTQCASATNCAWSVAVPNTLGTYKVVAVATDKAGRIALSNTITITVVNPGNVVGGVVDGVGSTVQGLGSAVQNAQTTLANTVNNLLGALHL